MTEETKCDCKEKVIERLKKFTFIAGAVFVGATLAILLSASILRPKCPCPRGMMMPPPRMERHIQPGYHHGADAKRFEHGKRHKAFKPQRLEHEHAPRINDVQRKQDAPVPAPLDKAVQKK